MIEIFGRNRQYHHIFRHSNIRVIILDELILIFEHFKAILAKNLISLQNFNLLLGSNFFQASIQIEWFVFIFNFFNSDLRLGGIFLLLIYCLLIFIFSFFRCFLFDKFGRFYTSFLL